MVFSPTGRFQALLNAVALKLFVAFQNALECKTCPSRALAAILFGAGIVALYSIGIVLGNGMKAEKSIAIDDPNPVQQQQQQQQPKEVSASLVECTSGT